MIWKGKTIFAAAFLFSIIGTAGITSAIRLQTYCVSNTTLTTVDSRFVFNGTWNNQIFTNNITCAQNVTCNNNSFFGAECDPPLLQQPFYLAAYALLGIIAMTTVVLVLKKVIK